MSDFISPYEISEMFHKKFDGFDFAQPYLIGEFKEDPRYGNITIGVRTPWYDIEYFVYSKASFDVGIAKNKLVEDSIKWAVGHLNAAVAMQLAPDGSKAQRFDLGDINKYQEDPEGYITEHVDVSEERKETWSVENLDNGEVAEGYDIYVDHNTKWDIDSILGARNIILLCDCLVCVDKRSVWFKLHPVYQANTEAYVEESELEVEKPGTNRDFDIYVHHDSNWSEHAMTEAEHVIFLCDCEPCVTRMKRVREYRREGKWL